mmetsp:Transcript_35884/g.78584  ORF Transcript_35884/g.78584 Transcript_35884/m.78584 type:complete len:100 (-) Transcript_35884:345-644(-)
MNACSMVKAELGVETPCTPEAVPSESLDMQKFGTLDIIDFAEFDDVDDCEDLEFEGMLFAFDEECDSCSWGDSSDGISRDASGRSLGGLTLAEIFFVEG